MEKRPRSLLLKFPGTSCDAETARALEMVGFESEIVPIAGIHAAVLKNFHLVVLPGGFSYGDHVMSGRFASLITRQKLGDALADFSEDGGFILGIGNGFQILTQLELLPGSLIPNTGERFQCRWVTLNNHAGESSPVLANLPDQFELPVAHAEGRFVATTPEEAGDYLENGSAALTYTRDINGSFANIAAMQDKTGRVLGMMPHPERFIYPGDHYDPDWNEDREWGHGYYLFKSLFEAVSGNFGTDVQSTSVDSLQ